MVTHIFNHSTGETEKGGVYLVYTMSSWLVRAI